MAGERGAKHRLSSGNGMQRAHNLCYEHKAERANRKWCEQEALNISAISSDILLLARLYLPTTATNWRLTPEPVGDILIQATTHHKN